jgi:hypothetical protein
MSAQMIALPCLEKILADMQPPRNTRRPHGVGGCDSAEAQPGRLRSGRCDEDNNPKPKRSRRKPKTTARNIELYSSAYQIAWKRISPLQKREQPNISLRIHASIRRQLKEGAKDPNLIASKAVSDLQTYTGVTYKRPGNGRRKAH